MLRIYVFKRRSVEILRSASHVVIGIEQLKWTIGKVMFGNMCWFITFKVDAMVFGTAPCFSFVSSVALRFISSPVDPPLCNEREFHLARLVYRNAACHILGE